MSFRISSGESEGRGSLAKSADLSVVTTIEWCGSKFYAHVYPGLRGRLEEALSVGLSEFCTTAVT